MEKKEMFLRRSNMPRHSSIYLSVSLSLFERAEELFLNKAGINLIWCTRRISSPVNAEFRYTLFLVPA